MKKSYIIGSFKETSKPINAEEAIKARYGVVRSWRDLAETTTEHAWTHIRFDGSRKGANFNRCDFMVFDIDEGMTIKEAATALKDYRYAISTTKSHQKDKHGIVCDRFRILLDIEHPITTAEEYEGTWNAVNKILNGKSDPAARDLARWWQPSVKVVAGSTKGKEFPVCLMKQKETFSDKLGAGIEGMKIKSLLADRIVKETPDKIQLRCPFHVDRNPSAVIFKKYGNFFCQSCGRKLSASELKNELEAIQSARRFRNYLKTGGISGIELLNTEFPEPDWLVEYMLPARGVSFLVGDSNTSKTFLCLDLCLSMIDKRLLWMNRWAPKRGNVMYWSFEDYKEDIGNRLQMLMRGRGLSTEAQYNAGDITFYCQPDMDLLLPQVQEDLIREIKEKDIKAVIFDTYRKVSRGIEENSSDVADSFLSIFHKVASLADCSVIATHHTSKLNAKNQMEHITNLHFMRGSSAIEGSVDSVINLVRQKRLDTGNRLGLGVAKLRNGLAGRIEHIDQYFIQSGDKSSVEWAEVDMSEESEQTEQTEQTQNQIERQQTPDQIERLERSKMVNKLNITSKNVHRVLFNGRGEAEQVWDWIEWAVEQGLMSENEDGKTYRLNENWKEILKSSQQ